MSDQIERLRDELAVLRCRRGEAEAVTDLVERWQRRLYAYVSAMLSDRQAAWDVCQEVWLGVVKGLKGRQRIECFPAWLYRIAHNQCVTHLRRNGGVDYALAEEPAEVAPAEGDVSDLASAAEDAALVREAVSRLPLAQRETVTLYYLNDMSVGEIAGILGVPVGTVQSRLYHARANLRRMLTGKGLGNG